MMGLLYVWEKFAQRPNLKLEKPLLAADPDFLLYRTIKKESSTFTCL
jgi:hypothetical protein